ncbi:MAG TPA: 4'-phosphopantetheinyl transferase superfamily protein [Terriglobales bacterium]|nr:4'-phosphopantetheinyl transferase superfamily protein [Terriglobales bacterium]
MNVVWLQQSEAQVPYGIEWLSASERVRLSGLRVPKRHSDWRLGRWTAKRAVALYLKDSSPSFLREIEVRPALSGAPEVFVFGQRAEFSVSLSHRVQHAMVALAPPGGAIGCDLEYIEVHSDPFVADYFTANEQLVIRRSAACAQAALVSLLWSAKESALKALHHGLRLDTRRLEVSLAENAGTTWENLPVCNKAVSQPSPHNGCDSAQHGWRTFTVTLDGEIALPGCWQRCANLIRTLIAEADLLPPALLDCHN